jgi:hypothetical protein
MKLEIKPGMYLEFSLAKIVDGKQEQLFSEYFPNVGPVVAEYGGSNAGGVSVVASNVAEEPQMGAMFLWPSAQAYHDLHKDARFQKLKPVRDEAFSYLSNGHFFDAASGEIELESNTDYLIAVTDAELPGITPLLDAPLASESPNQSHAGRRLVIAEWNTAAEQVSAHVSVRARINN